MANLTPRRDDRTYDQLVEALRRQLPPEEWTDHNASDPGIMLLELLCWLGEMASYRMDRVPESHENKFLDMLIDPPEPVTVVVAFTVDFLGATNVVTIPAGTQLATDFVSGRRVVFETVTRLELRRPAVAPLRANGDVRARAIHEVLSEELGVSDNRANQVYTLRPPRQALGIGADEPAPILTDFVHRAGFEPNPQVFVGTEHWPAEPSLLTEKARIPDTDGKRCAIDAAAAEIRFGDGVFGAKPPFGAVISCSRYAVLHGPDALRVATNQVRHVIHITAPLPADVTVTLSNTDAEGGANFFPISRRTELGLREFGAPYRLISERDFERAIMEDFNEFQDLSRRRPRIVRASIVTDRQPPLELEAEDPGHVTLVLIAGDPTFDETQFRSESVAVATKQGSIEVPADLWERLRRFLDPRRLLTTRLHRATPQLRPFTMSATVAVAADRNLSRVEAQLRECVYDFLSPIGGGFDKRGWRLGRSVYRSQLFRLLEDATDVGVDHVQTMTLSPADSQGNVAIGSHELPLLQTLVVGVTRA
jgi:hypothetical protein